MDCTKGFSLRLIKTIEAPSNTVRQIWATLDTPEDEVALSANSVWGTKRASATNNVSDRRAKKLDESEYLFAICTHPQTEKLASEVPVPVWKKACDFRDSPTDGVGQYCPICGAKSGVFARLSEAEVENN